MEHEESEQAALDAQARADASDPQAQFETLTREREEFRAHWQRSQADYQNLRRRLQSDIDAAVQRSKQPLLQSLLLVLDYLDMALQTPCTSAECKSLLAGVEMTRDALVRALEQEDVRPVPESGSFDAAVHQAVERVETSERAPGELIAVLRRGYTAGGQVLRPAQVRVATDPLSGPGAARDGSSSQSSASEGR